MFIDSISNSSGRAIAFREEEGGIPIFETQYLDSDIAHAAGSGYRSLPRSFELSNVGQVGSQATTGYTSGNAGTVNQNSHGFYGYRTYDGALVGGRSIGNAHNISDVFTSNKIGNIQVDAGSNGNGNWTEIYQNDELVYVLQTMRSIPLTNSASTTIVFLPTDMPDTNYKVTSYATAWLRQGITWGYVNNQFSSKCYRTNTTSALTGSAAFTAIWIKS